MSSLTITRPSVIKSTLHCLQSRSASILSSLSDTPGSYSLKKRRGRGPSSGRGKTSGRGHKGQKQHGKVPARFQGGQTPQWASKQIKGEGSEQNFTVEMSTVNLNKIQEWIRAGRLDPSRPITIKELAKSRCLHGVKDGVKLLAKGNFTLKSPINILVSRASASAIAAVEAAGGSVTTRYYTKLSIKKILSGEAENSFLPLADVANMGRLTANQRKMEALLSCSADRMVNPLASRLPDATSRKDIEYYRDEKHRGYLSHLVEKGHGPSLFFKTPGTGTVRSRVKKSGSTTAAENKLW